MRLTLVRRLNTLSKDLFKIHPSLAGGSSRTEAVVALESTVITHGMPYPQNLKLALSMEAIITEHGARPATIAVMDGKVSVGLNEEELSDLAKSKSCRKVSRRDLSDTLSKGLHGGTTVAATMLLAHQAGISVFATGGIGGVHRDGENSLDISADLTELGRTPVAVVCAGAKSILDIPRTLEFLETQGVCVATIGDTSDFPSFFSRKSGHHSPCHVANVQKAAELIHIQNRLNLQTGILFAVPIPQEDEIPNDQVEEWLQVALKEADSHDVRGRDITPFLLKRLTELSNGRTLTANLALLRNNAKVGAQIAVALKKLQDSEHGSCSYSFRSTHASQTAQSTRLSAVALEDEEKTGRPVVIGGTVLDIMASWNSDFQMNGATYSGELFMSCGGVGRNIADCLTRLGSDPILLSAIGQDASAQVVKKHCTHMDLSYLLELPQSATSGYVGLLSEEGQLRAGVMNMDIHSQITADYVSKYEKEIKESSMVVIDGNLSAETIDHVLALAGRYNVPVWYEPTDIHKAAKPFQKEGYKFISYLSPNLKELQVIRSHFNIPERLPSALPSLHSDGTIPHRGGDRDFYHHLFSFLPGLRLLLVKMGKSGSFVVQRAGSDCRNGSPSHQNLTFKAHLAPNVPDEAVVNVSGSGDCMAAGVIHGLINGWQDIDRSISLGTFAASCSLRSRQTVPAAITSAALN